MRVEGREEVETGRAIAPESARPSEDEIAALTYAFWKARGCPEWLWGGRAKSADGKTVGGTEAAMAPKSYGAKR
jgi:hypothetical protein